MRRKGEKMKRFLVCLMGIGCFVFCPAAAIVMAAPSMSGSTGLVRIPTADVLRTGQASAGYYYWHDNGNGVLALGVAKEFEISASAPWRNGNPQAWSTNAKLNIFQETLLYPAVAIGIEDIDGRERRSVYGVISKDLPYGLRIHFGAGTGRFDGLFGAVEKVLNPTSVKKQGSGFPVTSLIVEMDGNKMNYGLRLRLVRGLRIDGGWMGQTEQMYMGITYTY